MRYRSRSVVVIAVGLACSGACSGPEISDSTTTRLITPLPSTSSTSTTAQLSTTRFLPTTTKPIDSVEAAVRLVHTRFMTELFARDERVTGPEVILPLAEELTTGRQLKRIQESVDRDLASGDRTSSPGYESHIVSVEVKGDKASVVDCSKDRSEGYSSAGQLTIPADDFFKFRGAELLEIDGKWFVEDFLTGGDNRCNPYDY
jgi:hypothetical protein